VKIGKAPCPKKLSKLKGVLDIKFKDEAHIGIYDFCEIVPEYSSANLRITSGFPMEIILKMKERCVISVTSAKKTRLFRIWCG
jgi:hypothetical protein